MQSLTLEVDGKTITIGPLTVGQMEEIQEALFKPLAASGLRKGADRDIIAAALSQDHPELAKSVGTMRFGSIRKLDSTVREILKFGGFVDEKATDKAAADSGKDGAAGESNAGAPTGQP